MSQIAEDTGIGRATLYKYFPDVESILLAWHDREIESHLEYLVKISEHAGDGERLEVVLDAYAQLSQHSGGHEDGGLAALLHRDERFARAQRQVHGLIKDLLAAGVKAGDVRNDVPLDELASYCMFALGGGGGQRSKASIRRLVMITLAGLRPPMPHALLGGHR